MLFTIHGNGKFLLGMEPIIEANPLLSFEEGKKKKLHIIEYKNEFLFSHSLSLTSHSLISKTAKRTSGRILGADPVDEKMRA